MSHIRSTNTLPEIRVRKLLFKRGYRYKLHVRNLPGTPDIVLPKYGTAKFVHGCFWHLHEACRDGTIPKSRTMYWEKKLLGNRARDRKNVVELQELGWQVLQLWECEIEKEPEELLNKVEKNLADRNYNRSEG